LEVTTDDFFAATDIIAHARQKTTLASATNIENITHVQAVAKSPEVNIFLLFYYTFVAISITFDIILCTTLFKSNKIQKCNRNIIVLHWRFIDIFYLLAYLLTFRANHFNDGIFSTHYCTMDEFEGVLSLCALLFMLLLVIDSAFLRYSAYMADKFHSNYKLLIGLVYIFSLSSLLIFMQFCSKQLFHNVPENIIYSHAVFFIVIIVFNLVFWFKKPLDTYQDHSPSPSMTIVNSTVMLLIPVKNLMLLSKYMKWNIMLEVEYSAMILEAFCPIAIFIILAKVDRNFRAAFKQLLRCQFRRKQYVVNALYNNNGK